MCSFALWFCQLPLQEVGGDASLSRWILAGPHDLQKTKSCQQRWCCKTLETGSERGLQLLSGFLGMLVVGLLEACLMKRPHLGSLVENPNYPRLRLTLAQEPDSWVKSPGDLPQQLAVKTTAATQVDRHWVLRHHTIETSPQPCPEFLFQRICEHNIMVVVLYHQVWSGFEDWKIKDKV